MKNQNNLRIVETKNGSLLIAKGLDDNDKLCVHYSTIFETDGLFIEAKVTMSFKKEIDRDKGYNISDKSAEELFNSLLNQVEEALV